jgi:hypothetical protein
MSSLFMTPLSVLPCWEERNQDWEQMRSKPTTAAPDTLSTLLSGTRHVERCHAEFVVWSVLGSIRFVDFSAVLQRLARLLT